MISGDLSLHENFMRLALEQASLAADEGEVPIGAVIVRDGAVIAVGKNRRETGKNALLHAEIKAISAACKALSSWRLTGCDLYVTLEPCPMCAGAIINSRIHTVVYGASDRKAGACGSVINLFSCPFNHTPNVIRGVLETECSAALKEFFVKLRKSDTP